MGENIVMKKKYIGLFSFDGPMYKDKNGVYCNTTLTSEMFKRYFSVIDELLIVIRTYNIDKTYIEANLNKIELDNIKFIEIPNLNTIKSFIFKRYEYKKLIMNYVKKADLIFVRMPSIISDLTIQCCKKINKKYLVEVGGCAWDAHWNHSLIGKIIAPYVFYKEKNGVKNAVYATYVTEKWLQKRYPTKSYSISASNVYLDKLDKKNIEKRIEKLKKISKHKKITIGTIAAVNVKYKGQEYVIRAIARLKNEGYNIIYELVGGGDQSYLKGLAKKLDIYDNINFKGILLKNDIMNWLEKIDIYIQPSKQEGLPRALIEALSKGVPSLGATTAGIPELINKRFIFKKGNVDDIIKKLKKLLSSDLVLVSQENFNKSKEFELSVLNQKREDIYKKYRNLVENEDKKGVN